MCPSLRTRAMLAGPAIGSTAAIGPWSGPVMLTGPSPRPETPWQGEQKRSNFWRPLSSDASVAGRGFWSAFACASSSTETGGSKPDTGTVSSGGTNGSIVPSCGVRSKAWIDFCHFICGNQSFDHCSQQPSEPASSVTTSAKSARPTRRPRAPGLGVDKDDLLRAVAAQEGVDLGDVAVAAAHHHPELLGGEARAVGLVAREPGQAADDEEAEGRHQAAEEDRQLEADDRVGRDRGEGFAAEHDRPVVRHPD